ncbi:MAG: hypothetical protein V2J89_09180 [Halieaceae bacterium]|jgi:GDP-mannose 6-dehydrogenase|nr:hypothetical protein [Halieaceae bacterium]
MQHTQTPSLEIRSNIAVLGSGLGTIIDAVGFAGRGHTVRLQVAGTEEAAALQRGQSGFDEPGIVQQLVATQADDCLTFTTSLHRACHAADVLLVWADEQEGLVAMLEEVAAELAVNERFQLVAIRSLLTPGTMDRIVLPLLERVSGKQCGEDFGLAYSPEVIRPGVALADFRNPVRMLVGTNDDSSADAMCSLYRWRTGSICIESFATAETARIADLLWQNTKLRFAAELGSLCLETGVSRRAVIDAFKRDSKQNISACYLVPDCPVPEVKDDRVKALLTAWERWREMPLPLGKMALVGG